MPSFEIVEATAVEETEISVPESGNMSDAESCGGSSTGILVYRCWIRRSPQSTVMH